MLAVWALQELLAFAVCCLWTAFPQGSQAALAAETTGAEKHATKRHQTGEDDDLHAQEVTLRHSGQVAGQHIE